VGQFLNAADPVARVLQLDKVKVEVGIPESDVDTVGRVSDFTVTIDALDGRTYAGTRHYLSRTADTMARTYRLEIAVDNGRGDIRPDMFCRVGIVKRAVRDGLAVPLYALVQKGDGRAVYRVIDGKARLTPVRLGFQDGWRVQVVDGVAAGDHVVVVGQRDINDGQAVNVVRTVDALEELGQ
jgi:RND family efflux transporter MFP subunit